MNTITPTLDDGPQRKMEIMTASGPLHPADLDRLAAEISTGQRDAVITLPTWPASAAPRPDAAAFAAHCASHGATIKTIDTAHSQDPRAAAVRAALTSDGN